MERAALVAFSRDDLIALLEAQAEQVAALVAAQTQQIAALTARIADLEAKLANPPKTPDNSSLPPSKGQKPNLPDRGEKPRPGRPGAARASPGARTGSSRRRSLLARIAATPSVRPT